MESPSQLQRLPDQTASRQIRAPIRLAVSRYWLRDEIIGVHRTRIQVRGNNRDALFAQSFFDFGNRQRASTQGYGPRQRRATVHAPEVILVGGFFDCMRLHHERLPCVALMGCALSDAQEELLAAKFERVVVIVDGDE